MNSPAIIETIVSQHAEEAAFLWLQRDGAVHEPHYSLKDLAKLDDRVEAHLDGLRIAGEGGWSLCRKNLEIKEPGEVFAAGVLALKVMGSGLVICLSSILGSVNGEAPKNRICRCAVSRDLSRRWAGRYLSG
jgi:uncharacterized protein (TIGR02270 family)